MKDDKFEKLSDNDIENVAGGKAYIYKVKKNKYQVWNSSGKKVGTRKKEIDAYHLAKDLDEGNIQILDDSEYRWQTNYGYLDPYEDNE